MAKQLPLLILGYCYTSVFSYINFFKIIQFKKENYKKCTVDIFKVIVKFLKLKKIQPLYYSRKYKYNYIKLCTHQIGKKNVLLMFQPHEDVER